MDMGGYARKRRGACVCKATARMGRGETWQCMRQDPTGQSSAWGGRGEGGRGAGLEASEGHFFLERLAHVDLLAPTTTPMSGPTSAPMPGPRLAHVRHKHRTARERAGKVPVQLLA
eukprot:3319848-Rhodomonas_salina.1